MLFSGNISEVLDFFVIPIKNYSICRISAFISSFKSAEFHIFYGEIVTSALARKLAQYLPITKKGDPLRQSCGSKVYPQYRGWSLGILIRK